MPDYPNFAFEIDHCDPESRARTARLTTPHGAIETPNFIFCGTKAAIKGVLPGQMRDAGTGIILAKLDSSARGGMAFAIQSELGLPILFAGLGESPDDLQPFNPEAFVEGILADFG